jgi:hypothetical protein
MSYKDIANAKSPKEFINGFKKKKLVVSKNGPEDVTNEETGEIVKYQPGLPKVNVVPHTVFEKYQVKGIVRKFGLIAVGVVAVYGLIFAGGFAYTALNSDKVGALEDERATLTAEMAELQPFQSYRQEIESKRTNLAATTANDINMGTVYGSIDNSARGNDVTLTSLAVRQYVDGEQAGECTNPDPFGDNSAVIGCITISGTADNKDQVNGFLADLQGPPVDLPAYMNPFISTFTTSSDSGSGATGGGASSTFEATIAFTNQVFSNQYAPLAIPLQDILTPVPTTGAETDSGTPAEETTTESGN